MKFDFNKIRAIMFTVVICSFSLVPVKMYYEKKQSSKHKIMKIGQYDKDCLSPCEFFPPDLAPHPHVPHEDPGGARGEVQRMLQDLIHDGCDDDIDRKMV